MNAPEAPEADRNRLLLFGPAECLADVGVKAAVSEAEGKGWRARRVEVSDEPEAQLRRAVDEADLLVTFGGDGSLHLAASAVLDGGATCTLGLVPTGTGNDFARHVGLGDIPPGEALERLLGWPERQVDVMALPRPGGHPLRSVNAVSFGAIAGATDSTPDAIKAVIGKSAYAAWGAALAAVAEATSIRLRGERANGSTFSWSGPTLGVVASNGRFTGGGFHVAPTARLTNGRFELLVLPELTLAERYDLSRRLRCPDGDPPDADLDDWPPAPLVSASLVSLRAEASERLPLNTDGESTEADLLEIAIEPEILRMRLPAGA